MATASEVKAGIDDIATTIRNARQALKRAKAQMTAAKNELMAIPTTYATVVQQVTDYTPTGAFETLAKDEIAKLQAEFTALRTAATSAESALAGITEF